MDWFNERLDALEDGLDEEAGMAIMERRTSSVPGKIKREDPDQVAVITHRDAPQP